MRRWTRTFRVRSWVRRLGPVVCLAIAMAVGATILLAASASLAVGSMLPTTRTGETIDHRWMWVVADGTGYQVSSKTRDRCGVPILLVRRVERDEGLIANSRTHRRLVVVDNGGDLMEPGVRAVVVRELERDRAWGPWAEALLAPGRTVAERNLLGSMINGAVVVAPALALLGVFLIVGTRWGEAARRWWMVRTCRCATCGYSSLGLEPAGVEFGGGARVRCPECGEMGVHARADSGV